ncbi:MAG: methionine biosynthesis protein MetW [Candidatus Caenarcaniphilales bacterium]|nr:methionine biosynthesis protein MetW [Candidatus Caenarcaniphilales bacterium]
MKRLDHQIIYDLIPKESRVLDLGCADGSLMKHLKQKDISSQGIEINYKLTKKAIEEGMNIVQQDLDKGLRDYQDSTFDYVILNKTLQATRNPVLVIQDAIRIGRKVLISFTNFGYWEIRSQLFFKGKMPKSKDLPYEWYNTPNIHLVTISDFETFCAKNNFRVNQKIFYNEFLTLPNIMPNLFSPYALFVLSQ